jgi:hypothetical protein
METEQIRSKLKEIPTGAKVRLQLEDGAEVEGRFNGIGADDQVHVADSEDVDVGKVKTVLMDVGSSGPE